MLPVGRDNGGLMLIAFDGSDGVGKGNRPSPVEEGSTPVRSIISPTTWNHVISQKI